MTPAENEHPDDGASRPSDAAVPGSGEARDAENPTPRPTPDEQRERGQRAATELGAEAEDEIVEDDKTDERPGTSGVQPGLPAE